MSYSDKVSELLATDARGMPAKAMRRMVDLANAADIEIGHLSLWIASHGEQTDTCTYAALGVVCRGCGCHRSKVQPNSAKRLEQAK